MKERIIESNKVSAVTEEITASYNYITTGLWHLKGQSSAVSNNHVALQLFASGTERLLKILLLLKDKHLTGKFPNDQHAKLRFRSYANGHGIDLMLSELIDYSDTLPSPHHPLLAEAVDYLRNDKSFHQFLAIVTDFAIKQRYFYIDTIILDKVNNASNPFEQFKRFVYNFTVDTDVSEMSFKQEEILVLNAAVVCIEKGIRAICRFFTHGLGEEGKRYFGPFSTLILLVDQDLGKLSYLEIKTSPMDLYQPMRVGSFAWHKLLLQSKSKHIYREAIDEWTLTVDEATVFYIAPRYYFARIDDEVFSLTTKTATQYKLPNYNNSKHLKPGHHAIFLQREAAKLSQKDSQKL